MAAPGGWSYVSWQSEASRMQSEGVQALSAFSDSISTLCNCNDRVAELCRRLMEIYASDTTLEQLEDLGGVLGELCQFLETWLARADAGELRQGFAKVRSDLEDIFKIGVRFRVVATLTAINAGANSTAMDGFIEELRAVPTQIRSAVDLLLTRLEKVHVVVEEATETAHVGLAAMLGARDTLTAQSEASQAVFQQITQARQAIDTLGQRFLSESQDQTKVLVRGFQYSDFFAQRLDHVAQMLSWEDELGPSVRLLAARQLTALAAQGQQTVTDMEQALTQQSQASSAFLGGFTAQSKRGAAGNGQLRGIFGTVLTTRDQALPVIAKSVAASRQVLEEIERSTESFATLVTMSGVMDLAAINARVRAAREDKGRAAMAFLSSAVIEGASACREVLAKASAGLAKVAAVQDAQMLDQLVACVARFTAAFDACQQGLTAAEARAADLAVALTEVSDLIGRSETMLQNCLSTAAVLRQIVAELASFGEQVDAGLTAPRAWPDLSRIYDIYTIQDERDEHDRLLGREMTAPPPKPPLELDDIFF